MNLPLPITGGCACGKIRYECSAQPLFFFLCHCIDCQRASGGPFSANVIFSRPTAKYVSETPSSYTVKGVSGEAVHHEFCPNCGSPVGMNSDGSKEFRVFRASTLDTGAGLQPTANIWTSRAPSWHLPRTDIPSLATQDNG